MKNNNELRTYMNKEDTLEKLKLLYGDPNFKDIEILGYIKVDYEDLISLRNRLKEGEYTIFEDDHITLDHILDYIEIFMKLIGMEEE